MSHDSYFKNKPEVEDFKPVSILVFKNGDEYDPGTKLTVTRTRFPHWLHLLDYLTTRLQLNEGPVHHLYDLYQNELLHFKELENDGVYVAANKKFKQVRYNSKRYFGISKKPFDTTTGSLPSLTNETKFLNSKESYEIYLKNRNFRPKTVRDMWNDNPGKRTKNVSVGNDVIPYNAKQQAIGNQGSKTDRKFPYHLYTSTLPQSRKNNVQPNLLTQRSLSEPRIKVANAGTSPKQVEKFSYASLPKILPANSQQIVHTKIYKEANHQTDNIREGKYRGREHERNISPIVNGHRARQTRSTSDTRSVRLPHLAHSSLSDSKLNHHRIQERTSSFPNELGKPYLEIYKYYSPKRSVDKTMSAEWGGQSNSDKEVATQTMCTERATNTTASYLKQRQATRANNNIIRQTLRNNVHSIRSSPPRTADVTVPHWAKALQHAVSELSHKVEHMNV